MNAPIMKQDQDPAKGTRKSERQLETLRNWLSGPPWTVNEAAHILSGVEPGYGPSQDQSGGWRALPGLETPGSGEDWFGFDRNIEFDIHEFWRPRLSRIADLGIMSNAALLSKLYRANLVGSLADADFPDRINHTPPWLPMAQADPICAESLPKELRIVEIRADFTDALYTDPRSNGGSQTNDSHLVACFMLWMLRNDAKDQGKRVPGAKTAAKFIADSFEGTSFNKLPSHGSFKNWITSFGQGQTPEVIFTRTFSRNTREGVGLTADASKAEATRLLRQYLKKATKN